MNKNKIQLENEAKIIDFYSKMQSNLAIDGVHLTADGNKLLSDVLFDSINNK